MVGSVLVRQARGGRRGAWTTLVAGSIAGAAVMAMAAMADMTTVEDMQQWAQRQQHERQGAHQVSPVLRKEEKARHGDEAEEDPGQRGAAL